VGRQSTLSIESLCVVVLERKKRYSKVTSVDLSGELKCFEKYSNGTRTGGYREEFDENC
jgi:hypothetical protein